MTQQEIENQWKKQGDLGEVAQSLVKVKKQATLFSQELTTTKVYSNLRKIPSIEGIKSVDKKINHNSNNKPL